MIVRRAISSDDIAACLHIRRAVFIAEQNVSEADEIDGLDPVCRHFLALPEEASPLMHAFGTARMLFVEDRTAKAQRVAVLREARGRGVGAALMLTLEGEAVRAGRKSIILGAQLAAVPFYERLGYQTYGGVFLDAGIEHLMMRKSVV